jgi:hypothetical protein
MTSAIPPKRDIQSRRDVGLSNTWPIQRIIAAKPNVEPNSIAAFIKPRSAMSAAVAICPLKRLSKISVKTHMPNENKG